MQGKVKKVFERLIVSQIDLYVYCWNQTVFRAVKTSDITCYLWMKGHLWEGIMKTFRLQEGSKLNSHN